jgi:uncharacterized Zn-binding protein involved in type VI secretion
MPFAARVGDPTAHPGVVGGPGVKDVLIGGKPAAVAGTPHACSMPVTPPHGVTPFLKGSKLVYIGGRSALRVGDAAVCGAKITAGATDVSIGG